MATTKQKDAARENLKKARQAQGKGSGSDSSGSARSGSSGSSGLSTADKNQLKKSEFAFPEERKEPLTDAGHVRNAVSRFNQVEGVTDAERDKAWKRIKAAAKKFDVELSESDWRELG
ncbi:MAG TPA: DUF6582 domain-containing protein [Acidimicrobiales bacterium]|jgi:hypothetical protein|nr:DUF6582 domain-containing protein [Acidimicrobiales bacterium]